MMHGGAAAAQNGSGGQGGHKGQKRASGASAADAIVIDGSPLKKEKAGTPSIFLFGTSLSGLALEVLCDRLTKASGDKVNFICKYLPKKANVIAMVACGPEAYRLEMLKTRSLPALVGWDGGIIGEQYIPVVCERKCSKAECAAMANVLLWAKPARGNGGPPRRNSEGSAGKRAGGGQASGDAEKRRKSAASAAGGGSAGAAGSDEEYDDIYALLRKAGRVDIISRIKTDAAVRHKLLDYTARVYTAVAIMAPQFVRTESTSHPGQFFQRQLHNVRHTAAVLVALRMVRVDDLP